MKTSKKQVEIGLTPDEFLRKIGGAHFPFAKLIQLNVFWKNDQKDGFGLGIQIDENNSDQFRKALAEGILCYINLWDKLYANDRLIVIDGYKAQLDNNREFIASAGEGHAEGHRLMLAYNIIFLELIGELTPDEYNGTSWMWEY